MPTPSLILVPARFKTGKLYTPLATTSGDTVLGASGDFNVTRNTTATRVNASGYIESVASGIPRLDYPLGGGCPALLVEPSAQNFARNVQFITGQDTPAASGGLTITTGSTDFLAPDGTSGSITKYVGGVASGSTQYAYFGGTGVTVTAAGQHTFSLFVKAGATNPLNFCALQFTAYAGGSGTSTSYFSLASGTALTSGASIQNYGNGWYRIISAPYTIASGDLAGTVLFCFAEANNDITWPASGALNLTAYIWGAQMEAGSVATSYIPTTTAAVTRNADVISLSGAVSGCIGQTEGTIYWEGAINSIDRIFLSLTSGTSNSQVVRLQTTGAGLMQLIVLSGTIQANIGTSGAITLGQFYKVAVAYKENDFVFYLNGAQVGTDTSGTIPPALTQIQFSNAGATDLTNQRCRAVALYTTRLSDQELQALTT
jgi:hypothetical protein